MFAPKSLACFLIALIVLVASAFILPPILWWPLTLAYWVYEFSVTGLMIFATAKVRRPPPRLPSPPAKISVLIAAHNEADCILDTLASVTAQTDVEFEILVASDGSTDATHSLVARHYPTTQLLTLPKLGKAAALNSALALARHPIVLTLDADTRLAPFALSRLASAFQDPRVEAAGGWIFVRNASIAGWLVRWQFLEYIKNCLWRNGLAHLGVLLQVSGAFGAFRTQTLRDLGGFSRDHLTEDYEIIYRLHRESRLRHCPAKVVHVSDAVAYTEAPDRVLGFIHQRTRWFAGFLRTLWDYRKLIGNPRFGRIGLLMLPIKTVDSLLPIWGLFSWLALTAAFVHPRTEMVAHIPNLEWIAFAFGLKWIADVSISLLAWRWHLSLTENLHPPMRNSIRWLTILTETWFFAWFRQIAVIRAYGWFFRGIKEWKQSRWSTPIAEEVQS